MRSAFLGTCCLALVLGASACASEPSPGASDTSSDTGAPLTGSTTHDASTSSTATTLSNDSTTTPADDTRGTTSTDSTSDALEPDLGAGPQPSCHPLQQDCPEGEACYPIDGVWQCAPDASGDTGAYGDPCDADDACDPGLACLNPNALPPGLPCEAAAGCCTVLCDFSDPAASLTCPSAKAGQLCLPWYPEGEAPRGYEDVGACSLWP